MGAISFCPTKKQVVKVTIDMTSMSQTVKTRIGTTHSANNATSIPPTYKRTKAGVIPSQWKVRSLRSCLRLAPSYGINAVAVPLDDGLPTYLRITDIGGENQISPSPRVSVSHKNAETYFLSEGDLVFARTGASVGKSYLYNSDHGPLVFAGFLIRLRPNPRVLQPAFLSYWFQSKRYWDWVATMSIRSGQPGINGQELGTLQIPLPELSEQRAIAEALLDVDGLLSALEALIGKKRAIKQAAMQQLLTGKIRLPGFNGTWETRRLGELTSIRIHKVVSSNVPMDTPYVELDDIGQGNGRLLECSTAQKSTSTKYRFFSDDVLFGRLRPYLRKFWHADRDGICTTEIWPLVTAPQQVDSGFLYSIVQSDQFIEAASISYGTHMPRADWDVVGNLEISLPQVQEQRAIATVFIDMEAEIEALELRRDKTRTINPDYSSRKHKMGKRSRHVESDQRVTGYPQKKVESRRG